MDKSAVINFVNTLKEKGIENFVIRYEGGNRFTDSKSDSSRIYLGDEYVVAVDTTNNFTNATARFNVRLIPYDNIDDIVAYDLNTADTIEVLKAEGCWNDDMKELIKARGGRVFIKPVTSNTSNYAEEKEKVVDEETGEETLETVIKGDQPGRITTGYNK